MWILGGIVVLQVTASAEREDAHPQQPFTIIYSHLPKYGKREREKKERKREGEEEKKGRGDWEGLAL